jgi:Inorganic Pyrophosphatase
MPLKEGSSDEAISENIAELMRTGKYSHDQAIAIAYRKAGRSKTLAKALAMIDYRAYSDPLIEEPDAAVAQARAQSIFDTARGNNAILFAVVPETNVTGVDNSQGATDSKPSLDQKISGEYAKRTIGWQGLTVSIENEAGSHREGTNRDGEKWRQEMPFAYGYINATTGIDGDCVDVFLGPNLVSADYVYVVHARKVNRWDEYDEDKVMLGFDTEEEAIAAFLASYSDPRFLGPVTRMLVSEFVERAKGTKDRPAMIKALFIKAHGAISDSMRAKIGRVGSEKREDEPADVFLEPGERKFPVKMKRNGKWGYSRDLLLAASRRARMEGKESLAKHADSIRENL